MLKAVKTDLFNPLVPKAHNCEWWSDCTDIIINRLKHISERKLTQLLKMTIHKI